MSESDFNAILDQFNRLCRPSPERCLNCVAALRAMVRKIVTEGTHCGEAVTISDHEIEAEAATLRAAFPAGPFIDCPECQPAAC